MWVCAQVGLGCPLTRVPWTPLLPQRLLCQPGAEQERALPSRLLTNSLMGLWFCSQKVLRRLACVSLRIICGVGGLGPFLPPSASAQS